MAGSRRTRPTAATCSTCRPWIPRSSSSISTGTSSRNTGCRSAITSSPSATWRSAPTAKVWFGTQWAGDPLDTPPLVGRGSLEGGLELVADAGAGGATPCAAISARWRRAATAASSAPRRRAAAPSAIGARRADDISAARRLPIQAASPAVDDRRFLASNGEGLIVEAGVGQRRGGGGAARRRLRQSSESPARSRAIVLIESKWWLYLFVGA